MKPAQGDESLLSAGWQPSRGSIPTSMQEEGKRLSFSAYDCCGLGKKIIYLSPFMSWVAMQKQVVKQGIIWSDFLNYYRKRPWQRHRARVGPGRTQLGYIQFCFSFTLASPITPGEFIYSSRPNAAYKWWLLNPYLWAKAHFIYFFGARSIYPTTYQIIHLNVL